MGLKFERAKDGSWVGYRAGHEKSPALVTPEENAEESSDYEEQLAALAAANGIDIAGKSRRQVENLLKKAGVDYAK